MSLTIYDPTKGCHVLNPEQFKPIVNAFHPDYVKTYMPEFMTGIRTESMQRAYGVVNGGKSKAAREAKRGKSINTINLDVKQYFTYARAGMPKGVAK